MAHDDLYFEMDERDIFMQDCLKIMQRKILETNRTLCQMEIDIKKLMQGAHERSTDRLINNEIVYGYDTQPTGVPDDCYTEEI